MLARGASWMVVLLLAACSTSSAGPPVLGGCTTSIDSGARCGSGAGAGAGGGGPGSGGGSDASATLGDASAGACGNVAGVGSLATSNTNCAPLLTMYCCAAAAACSDNAACVALLSCPASEINACEAQDSSGVTAYNDLAACVLTSCTPACPTLPQPTPGDF